MVDIKPFRALRYVGISPEKMGNVTSPPYDVFNRELQDLFYEKHPNNIVRLIQARKEGNENNDDSRVIRAIEFLKRCKKNGVLVVDEKPCLFPYKQIFTLPSGKNLERNSFFTTVKLEEYGKGKIFPHEQTFPKPKGYLLDLWGKSGAHLGPIFSFYDDVDDFAINSLSSIISDENILADFEEDGVRHKLWYCDDPNVIDSVKSSLANKDIFIADGHHRYETSLNLRQKENERGEETNTESNYTLMCLANLKDPGMIILPTHRMLREINTTVPDFLNSISELYDVIEEPDPGENGGTLIAENLKEYAKENNSSVFCFFDGKESLRYLIRKNNEPKELKNPLDLLDVTLLQSEIIDAGLKASHDDGNMSFTPDPEVALSLARAGEYKAVLLLNPTPIDSVCEIAKKGGKMPHKSTYFYPKLRTGLVIHPFSSPAID
ncbi:MAG: DUF1015 domain-containing protein [Nitrospinota bacterium]|nr:DUF1015 domain-containing protein [Nitrospinota bacterium]